MRVAIGPVPARNRTHESAAEESLLDRIAQKKRVIICELDPPKTLAFEKFFAGAQALVKAGCDAITLADNSLAILRVSNLAMGAMLKERFGITPLLHLSCRDRNVLGLQSELLGMAALGMRHVLPLTGDPSRVGDHPGAASVYDVNSVELISIIKRLNEGFSQAGKSIRSATGFVIGCTFNPNARNLDSQVNRLERKVAAGAQLRDDAAGVRRSPDRGDKEADAASEHSDFRRCLAAAQRRAARKGDRRGNPRALRWTILDHPLPEIRHHGRTGRVCTEPLK